MRPFEIVAALRRGACIALLIGPAGTAVAGCLPDALTLWIAPGTDGLVFDTPHEACARADFTVWCGPPVGGGPLGGWSSYHCAYGCNPPEHCPYNPGWLRVRQAGLSCADQERWEADAQRCAPAPTPDTGRPRCGLSRGNPVHVGTGNKFEAELDFSHGNSPLMAVRRYYNSHLGYWRFSFDQKLTATRRWSDLIGYQETVVLERADGRGLECLRDPASGQFICTADRSLRIEALDNDADGAAWQVSTPGGAREWYGEDGRLLRQQDASGAEVLYEYDLAPLSGGDGDDFTVDRLRDRWGNALSVLRSALGVSALVTADGDRYDYLRRADGLLTAVRYPAAPGEAPPERRYLYEDPLQPNALTGIIDELGVRFATWAYNDAGQVVSSSRAGAAMRHTFTYNANGTTTVTEHVFDNGSEPISAVTTYRFSREHGLTLLAGIEGDHCRACGKRRDVTYDGNGFPASVTAPDGTVTEYSFDAEGHELMRLEAAGTDAARRTDTTWDPQLRRPATRDVYDAAAPQPRHVLHTSFYYADRRLVSMTEYEPPAGTARTTGYAYYPPDDSRAPGRLREIDGPLTGERWYIEYDGNANPAAYINPMGHRFELANHDGAGRPGLVRDANGVETIMTWHPRGWLLGTRTGGVENGFSRDAAGRLVAATNPLGGTTRYDYDAAGRLTGIATPAGDTMTRILNASGSVIRTLFTAADGGVHYTRDFSYDAEGRLTGTVGGAGQHWQYWHDAAGRVVGAVDPRRDGADQPLHVTVRRYDALGRLIEQDRPDGGAVRLAWDALDQLTSVEDGRGLSTRYDYDAFGALRLLESPDTGRTVFSHDAAGAVRSRLDARGRLQVFGRDLLGRVTIISGSSDALRGFAYDYGEPGCHGTGRLTAAGDGNGILRLCYDAAGRVTELAPAGLPADRPIVYRRDAAGFVRAITYPSGLEVRYDRDTMGRAVAVDLALPVESGEALPQPLISNIAHAPFGPPTDWTLHYGGGMERQAAVELDADYRVVATRFGGGMAMYFSYDAAGNVVARSNGNAATSFEVDGASRLVAADSPAGARIRYAYDDNGNITLRERRTGAYARATSFEIDAGSNRIHVENTGLAGRRYREYDASGNQTRAFSSLSGAETVFTYSDANRLIALQRSIGAFEVRAEAAYNALGQRIALDTRYAAPLDDYNRSKRFVYGAGGNLLSEQLNDRWRYDYVYLDDMPIAFVFYPESGPAMVYHYHVDNLGTPHAATAVADGALAWQVRPDAGDPFRLVASATGGVSPGLRFPGQYADPETGNVNNYFRDYDVQTGRYRQSDPIGLAGGLNTYAYALNNPLRYSDRLGLTTQLCRRPLNRPPTGPTLPILNHTYVCVGNPEDDWTCNSTTAKFGSALYNTFPFGPGSPGSPTDPEVDYFEPNACTQVLDDDDCVERCIQERWEQPRPWYRVGYGGTDCQEYSRDVILSCERQCKQ